MTKTAFIATIGTRDIQVSHDELFKITKDYEMYLSHISPMQFDHCVEAGKKLLKHKDHLKKAIQLPIISPAIDFLYRNEISIDRFFLIATNQKKIEGEIDSGMEIPEKHWKRDTYTFAVLIKELSQERFQISKDDIDIIEIIKNVTKLDFQYRSFQNLFQASKVFEAYERIFYLYQGGIEAINVGLLLSLINKYGNRVQVLNVDEDGMASKVFIGEKLNQDRLKRDVKMMLTHFDYSAIAELEGPSANLKEMSLMCHERLQFNFESAYNRIEKLLLKDENMAESYLTIFRKELKALKEAKSINKGKILLRELVVNTFICWDKQEYVNFLIRFFRVIEGSFHLLASLRFTQLEIVDKKRWKGLLLEMKNENKNLEMFLSELKVENQNLSTDIPNREVWRALCKFLLLPEKHGFEPFNKDEKELIELMERSMILGDLRNKSIGGHDFEPVSKELIHLKLKGEENLNRLREILYKIFDIKENPFERMNTLILEA